MALETEGFSDRLADAEDLQLKELLIRAAGSTSFYQDQPSALPASNNAQSFEVRTLRLVDFVKLRSIRVRVEIPASAGESCLIRIWRFRRPIGGGLSIHQITDSIIVDNTQDFSIVRDVSAAIRNGFGLDETQDSLAIGNAYTAGGAPAIRALRVDVDFEVHGPLAHTPAGSVPFGGPAATWPPGP